eukprot:TRINITY_DN30663_c0_g1_i1.p1 TRINITY_DN30663_c0_g1~~TRINITY_DN30663_c0_g1_i1.p1  ORF type:complete len:390 (-),score=74.17 TRINITY_DN30663_c0_g1_i1:153-1322(-)
MTSCIQAGSLLAYSAEWSRAEGVLVEALGLLQEMNEVGTARHIGVLWRLADLRARQGLLQDASELIHQAIIDLESAGLHCNCEPTASKTLVYKGISMKSQEDSGKIKIYSPRQNLKLPAVDQRREYASLLRSYGELLDSQGRIVEALQQYEQARCVYEILGDHGKCEAHASLLLQLSICHSRRGQHDLANELLTESLSMFTECGLSSQSPSVAGILIAQGRLALAQGRSEEALEIFQNARRAHDVMGATRNLSYCRLLLTTALCYMEMGGVSAVDAADEVLEEARVGLDEIGATGRLEFTTLPMFAGKALLERGLCEEALPKLQEARIAFESAGAESAPEYAWLLLVTGRCLLKLGCHAKAMDLFYLSQEAYQAAGAGDAFAQLALRGV